MRSGGFPVNSNMNIKTAYHAENIHKALIVLGWLLIIIVIAAYNWFDIQLMRLIPKCLFLEVTGYYCPGCGGTRAVHNLLEGNILESIRLNFLPLFTAAFAFLLFFQHTLNVFLKTNIRVIVFKVWMLWPIAAIVIAFGIIRNIL